jgi:hypothetical protein
VLAIRFWILDFGFWIEITDRSVDSQQALGLVFFNAAIHVPSATGLTNQDRGRKEGAEFAKVIFVIAIVFKFCWIER